MDKRTKKKLSADNALLRMGKFCAYRDRSMDEVKKKLKSLDVSPADAKIVMEKLTKQGFIDENRFAKSFAGGKFRIKKWGRKKIEIEMKKKGISEELIEKGLKQLPEKEYLDTLDSLLQKKWKQIMQRHERMETTDNYETKQHNQQKLIRFALQKGYEMDLVMERIKSVLK
ncbi:MAG: regulatory protein RecX [Bacteroidia bacterium]